MIIQFKLLHEFKFGVIHYQEKH